MDILGTLAAILGVGGCCLVVPICILGLLITLVKPRAGAFFLKDTDEKSIRIKGLLIWTGLLITFFIVGTVATSMVPPEDSNQAYTTPIPTIIATPKPVTTTSVPSATIQPTSMPTPTPMSTPESTPKPTIAPTPTPAPVPTSSGIHLTGTGDQASQKFHLDSGLAIFNMKHSGSSNFAIWLLDNMGNKEDLLVNEIGPFDGAKAEHISTPGDYVLDISADGQWDINVQQSTYTTADKAPVTLSGKGQQVSKPFYLNTGLATFKMTHDGSSNFAIWLLDAKGNKKELLVNDIGPYDGSKALGVKAGVYLLDINADGNWNIQIS